MNPNIEHISQSIIERFERIAKNDFKSITPLTPEGSARLYFRIKDVTDNSFIGTYDANEAQRNTFFYLSEHFHKKELAVPHLLYYNADEPYYIQEDKGETALLTFLLKERKENLTSDTDLPPFSKALYKKALQQLAHFQVQAAKELDFSRSYPRAAFDKRAILWDLQYFKYYFAKPLGISYSEEALENDFEALADFLLDLIHQLPIPFFMYRDFQARNILLDKAEEPSKTQLTFIDYQGGRQGTPFYDAVSLLFQAKARLTEENRTELLVYYNEVLSEAANVHIKYPYKHIWACLLIRFCQVLGAYGFRGLFERKKHFIESIPPAMDNVAWWLDYNILPLELPELKSVLGQIVKYDLELFRSLLSDQKDLFNQIK